AAGRRYRKHFLNLDGLGIRALMRRGEDLLILAGPTMDLDGPSRLYRWRGAMRRSDEWLVPPEAVVRLLELPHGEGCDHAEGIALVERPRGGPALLVVYDSPAPQRVLPGGRGVAADLFAF